jgi:hypothetical protein
MHYQEIQFLKPLEVDYTYLLRRLEGELRFRLNGDFKKQNPATNMTFSTSCFEVAVRNVFSHFIRR